jgi:hypothetical protein
VVLALRMRRSSSTTVHSYIVACQSGQDVACLSIARSLARSLASQSGRTLGVADAVFKTSVLSSLLLMKHDDDVHMKGDCTHLNNVFVFMSCEHLYDIFTINAIVL